MLPSDFQAFLETVGLVWAHDVAQIALVEMDMAVDVGGRGKPASSVELICRATLDPKRDIGDPIPVDADVPLPILV